MNDPQPGATPAQQPPTPGLMQHPSVPLRQLLESHDLTVEAFVSAFSAFGAPQLAIQLLDPAVAHYPHVRALANAVGRALPNGPTSGWWRNYLANWNALHGAFEPDQQLYDARCLPELVLHLYFRKRPYTPRSIEGPVFAAGAAVALLEGVSALCATLLYLDTGSMTLKTVGGIFLMMVVTFVSAQFALQETLDAARRAWPHAPLWPNNARSWGRILANPLWWLSLPGQWAWYWGDKRLDNRE